MDAALTASLPKQHKKSSKSSQNDSKSLRFKQANSSQTSQASKKPNSYLSSTAKRSALKNAGNDGSGGANGQALIKDANGTNRKGFVVLDDRGNDVTPRPLLISGVLGIDASSLSGVAGKDKKAASNKLHSIQQSSMAQSGAGGIKSSMFGLAGGMFASSQGLKSSSAANKGGSQSSHVDEYGSTSSNVDATETELLSKEDYIISMGGKSVVNMTGIKMIRICLSETSTIEMLDIPPTVVSNENTDEYEKTKIQNDHYAQVKKANANSSDALTDRSSQTLSKVFKTQESLSSLPKRINSECQASGSDEYDRSKGIARDSSVLELHSSSTSTQQVSSRHASMMSKSVVKSSSMTSESAASSSLNSSSFASMNDRSVNNIESSKNLKNVPVKRISEKTMNYLLNAAESEVIKDFNLQKVLIYYDDILQTTTLKQPDPSISNKKLINMKDKKRDNGTSNPELGLLWSFKSELTKGRPIRQFAWHKKRKDIIASTYGNSAGDETNLGGLTIVWSIKNPELPIKVYRTKYASVSLDFSSTRPGLLAVGCANGSIAVFNLDMDTSDEPIWISSAKNIHHFDSVTHLQWCLGKTLISSEAAEMEESLVSVSLDGRVLEWRLERSLECLEIFTLYRVSGDKKEEGASVVSPLNSALAIDIKKIDPSIYLVATQEGTVHECSRDSSEKYLNTWNAHDGPVYRVLWSPDCSKFLTCSADWAVMVWKADDGNSIPSSVPLNRYQTGKCPINDVSWYPRSNSVFAYVTDDGRIEIWSTDDGHLDPLVTHTIIDRRLTQVSFSPDVDCVLTGDSNGSIAVFKMKNIIKTNKRLGSAPQN